MGDVPELETIQQDSHVVAYKAVYPPKFMASKAPEQVTRMDTWYSSVFFVPIDREGWLRAECRCDEFLTYPVMWASHHEGPIPHLDGGCGFYAWNLKGLADSTNFVSRIMEKDPLIAWVLLGGRIIEYDYGYRAEYMRMISVAADWDGPSLTLEEGDALYGNR